jgi:hypothetical protein
MSYITDTDESQTHQHGGNSLFLWPCNSRNIELEIKILIKCNSSHLWLNGHRYSSSPYELISSPVFKIRKIILISFTWFQNHVKAYQKL